MFHMVAGSRDQQATGSIEFVVASPSPEDLVVDVLSQLLYESEVRDAVFRDIEVDETGSLTFRIGANSVPIRKVLVQGPPIKAVTYHDLRVCRTADGWEGRVFFDV